VKFLALGLLLAASAFTQAPQDPDAKAPETPRERWNLYWQATSIGQTHGTFRSAYQGTNSLQDVRERDVSLTTTVFLGLRISNNWQLYFDPEIAGGRGFSAVTGIANFPNGELPRVASATPKPYLARLYTTYDFGFGPETENVESDANQLAGARPVKRYSVTAGRFTVTDFFDNNRYTHDPRTQFMGWSAMFNGAWDYPADTRGYTWGWVHEFHTRNWSFRYASAAISKTPNGLRFDRRLFRDRGDVYEIERRYAIQGHSGAFRILGYTNRFDGGTYAQALKLAGQTGQIPDIGLTRHPGTLKYGTGVSWDQEIIKDLGLFARLGWNDGKTESFEFTAIDRMASGGVSLAGSRWRRKNDTVATGLFVAGISGVHANYLAHGGLDFIIGDGKLQYGPEYSWESYYSAELLPGVFTTFDLQHIANPAFNQSRGPVWVESLRVHLEFGKK
jgi:high affinity Mn2+ porin